MKIIEYKDLKVLLDSVVVHFFAVQADNIPDLVRESIPPLEQELKYLMDLCQAYKTHFNIKGWVENARNNEKEVESFKNDDPSTGCKEIVLREWRGI